MLGLSPRNAPSIPLDSRPVAYTWLLIALALIILPHVPRMPLWITFAVCCLGMYRLMHDHVHWRLPSRWLITLASLLALFGIMVSFGAPTGRRAAIAFLIILLGLKLLETRTQRDVMVLSCIGYFLIITNFLYSQSLPMVMYLLGIVWLLTVTLMHFQHLGDVDRRRLRSNVRQGSLLLLQALPLMVVLFLFFPRLDGPIWGIPEDAGAGVTGFSDHMSPGSISRLNTSSAVAFRVEFNGAIPPAKELYWRGLVLWHYDGHTWRQGRAFPARPIRWRQRDSMYTYTITLEPHDKPWLFSLDLPAALLHDGKRYPFIYAGHYDGLGTVTNDFQLRTRRSVINLRRYTLQSYAAYQTGELSEAMRRRALQLPDRLHPRVRHLAQQWRQASANDAAVIQRALDYFHEQDFVYTLTPPALTYDPTYEFLFDTRRGYCEHFASAFAVLMRAAGIPARVVIGYQGGEVNRLGQHLTVRQSNAHAWSEVWLDDQGWVRVDPTAAVAPDRIELGIESLPELSAPPFIIRTSGWLTTMWRNMRMGLDILQYEWSRWVLYYSFERQTQLMDALGLGALNWRGLTLILVGLMSVTLAILALRMFRRHTPRDRLALVYQKFCDKLARRGLLRKSYEGPFDFARRVRQQRPDLAAQVSSITRLYGMLRYGSHPNDNDLKRFQAAVRAFRP
jgi:transglutaminase-like putative cysteine protease